MVDFCDLHRQLISACREGDDRTVETILDHEVDGRTAEVDVDGEDGFTPLQVAAGNGHEAIVRLLLRRGAALDRQNAYGWTALMQAASHGHANIVKLLLQNKANPNITNKLGSSALTVASHHGHTSVVRILLDVPGIHLNEDMMSPADVIQQVFTPLMAAVLKGNDIVVRLLLDKGSKSYYRDQHTGWTPLMMAALAGHMTTAQLLIDRGGNPNAANVLDRTALEIATLASQREVREYLDRKTTRRPKIAPEKRKPKIIEATEAGDIGLIGMLLDEDPKQCNATSSDGATPLMLAAMLGRQDIADLLIQRNADVDKQDTKSGWTALMQATFHRRRNLVRYLVNAGADVKLQAKDGCTALDLAFVVVTNDNEKGGNSELIHLLASVTMPLSNGKQQKGQNGSSASLPNRLGSQLLEDDSSKNGLKSWWSRMSNRFRNLKLSRTLRAGLSTTKLMPFEEEDNVAVSSGATLKRPKENNVRFSETSAKDDGRHRRKRSSKSTMDLNQTSNNGDKDSGLDVSMKSFQSAQTMIIPSPVSNQPNDKLLPVIPPFLPPPSFELNSSGRSSRSSSYSSRTTLTQLAKGQVNAYDCFQMRAVLSCSDCGPGVQTRKPNKLLFTRRTGGSGVSPSNSAYFSTTASPNSSGDTTTLSKGLSVARPPRLPTLGSPRSMKDDVTKSGVNGDDNQEPLFIPAAKYHNSRRQPPTPKEAKFEIKRHPVNHISGKDTFYVPLNLLIYCFSLHRSPPLVAKPTSAALTNSSTSSTISGSLPPPASKQRPVSGTSRSSTTNTLTPAPSPKPGASSRHGSDNGSKHSLNLSPGKKESSSSGVSEEDELAGMLKKLSLEKYAPIFEEQEVDMEAFLSLNETDLKDLGISQSESRHQMLHAITKLNDNRNKARHHYPRGATFTGYAASSVAGSIKGFEF
ncbi:ankyrin repeat and SAM domain-containing protein 6-like [Amphiura filiformis]|uniref:ankyrin repeat and SAM domain-containing protein 6-like n=1 Tax=Amphiura filiformis TaxID=82378 RepID=UPI003B228F8A